MNLPSGMQLPSWMTAKAKSTGYVDPMEDHVTPRRCSVCIGEYKKTQATHWKYKANKAGGINKSSRKPVCAQHL